MSLMDKMKAAAKDAASAAKKGAAAAKDKAGDALLRRKADDAAQQIGYLIYREKTQGATPGVGEIDRLVEEIASLEAKIAESPDMGDESDEATGSAETAETSDSA
jgi:hypothetical protein